MSVFGGHFSSGRTNVGWKRLLIAMLTGFCAGMFTNPARSSTFGDPLSDFQWNILENTDAKLSKDEATRLAQRFRFPCSHVVAGGPVGASFYELYGLEKASKLKDPRMALSVRDAVDRGLHCRLGLHYATDCTSVAYINPTLGTLLPPILGEIGDFQKYGALYGGYVAVRVPITFKNGREVLAGVMR